VLPERKVAAAYAIVIGLVATMNWWPGIHDDQGRVFGIFALDFYDDLLHAASAAWAAIAALTSKRASRIFLQVFGALYLLDGLLGLATGSGYLDLGIVFYGVLDQPLLFNFLASAPHIALGGFALFAGLSAGRRAAFA
jgi:Domain of unknown function (DUF4383)